MKIDRVIDGRGDLQKGEVLLFLDSSLKIGTDNKEITFIFSHAEIKQYPKAMWSYGNDWVAYKIKHGGTIDED